jgi:CheY-like chemotaxis protein
VVVTADVQSSSHELAEQAGAKAFINKPFDRTEILGALNTALGETPQ